MWLEFKSGESGPVQCGLVEAQCQRYNEDYEGNNYEAKCTEAPFLSVEIPYSSDELKSIHPHTLLNIYSYRQDDRGKLEVQQFPCTQNNIFRHQRATSAVGVRAPGANKLPPKLHAKERQGTTGNTGACQINVRRT